jgi:hypothetical protein
VVVVAFEAQLRTKERTKEKRRGDIENNIQMQTVTRKQNKGRGREPIEAGPADWNGWRER